jgi:predicted flap endonuclease-1-like 5' DNA nuclease
MTKLATIEGIGDVYDGKLAAIGIDSVEALLQAGASPKGRADLAEKSGISGKLILEWVNRADLYRIRGISEEYSDLLESAGVDTVPELAQRNAANLHAALVQVNGEKKLVRHLPGESQVAAWIEQAKALPRVVTY